jgi:hypothetical protein
MFAARRTTFLFAGLAVITLFGCKTTPKPDPAASAPVVAQDFAPVSALSPLHLDSGRYPNLFAPGSYAVWVTDAVAVTKLQLEQKSGAPISETLAADAELVAKNYYVVEVNIESAFPDASIAYDVVGLRSVDVYLTLPDGTRVWPVQRVLGATARDQQEGALKHYGRTNIVVFPKTDVLSGTPTVPNGVTGLRLTLDGFNSIFHFEWAAAPSLSSPPVAPQEAGGLTWSGLYGKLRELSRMTQ